MTAAPGDRLLAQLPAVYWQADASGDLGALLAAVEALFFGDPEAADAPFPGIERTLLALPALFAPLGSADAPDSRTPDRFLPWLADWLAFTPHRHFEADALRRILAGIVPLYGMRGTRAYLLRLLKLCFDELRDIKVDDRPRAGFTIGASHLGTETRLGAGRAFWFEVIVDLNDAAAAPPVQDGGQGFERRLRAVIDFAKPAHTSYGLRIRSPARPAAPVEWHDRSG